MTTIFTARLGLLLCLLLCSVAGQSQPGRILPQDPELFQPEDYCPFEPINYDLNGDGIYDFMAYQSVTTCEDIPPSCWSCSRGLTPLRACEMLSQYSGSIPNLIQDLKPGDQLKQELKWPRQWIRHMPIELLGSGGNPDPSQPTPWREYYTEASKYYAFVLHSVKKKQLGWLKVNADPTTGLVVIESYGLVDADEELIIGRAPKKP